MAAALAGGGVASGGERCEQGLALRRLTSAHARQRVAAGVPSVPGGGTAAAFSALAVVAACAVVLAEGVRLNERCRSGRMPRSIRLPLMSW